MTISVLSLGVSLIECRLQNRVIDWNAQNRWYGVFVGTLTSVGLADDEREHSRYRFKTEAAANRGRVPTDST